ncbi:MAG: DUF1559 domain-containing protein [Pirellulales bacterium]|nr:DUF1559 domain-containing protein [Pirellulales bacterium]
MCAQQAMCTHQLKEIALGLRSYHDKYGVFPPPYVADAQGKPMHSWRVLILPFVGMDSVYNVYRFDEPWDSKNNKKLADMMSLYYACPGKYDDTPPWTDYVALIGPGTMWEEGRACKLEDITDGPKRTLMIVEMADSGIPWNAPFDVPLKEVLAIDPELAKTIRSYHLSKYADEPQPMGNVAFADGHVDCVPGPLTPENFKALVTIAGGENVDTRNLEALTVPRLKPFMSLFWTRLIGWAILLVSFVYLVSRPLPERWIRPRGQAEAAEVSNTASDNKAM